MGAFTNLSAFFNVNLARLAEQLKYSQANVLILNGQESDLKEMFPGIHKNILTCSYNADYRTEFEYAQDLVASWLFEDYIVAKCQNIGYSMLLQGADKNREILPYERVSASSDCVYTYEGKSIPVEIMCDYTGYWSRNLSVDLRDEKFYKLQYGRSAFLGISTVDKTYILLDFRHNIPATYIESHRPYGGKPAYSVTLTRSSFKDFTMRGVCENLNDLLEK